MPEIELADGATVFYRDDDFGDPWESSEPLVLLHGIGESGETYNRWMPRLAERFRVVRIDQRGFGRSSPMPVDYPWTVDGIVDDFVRLVDALELESFHLVGSKIGASLALRFAALHSKRIRTLTAIAPRTVGKVSPRARPETRQRIEREGIEKFLRETMPGRLGEGCPPELFEGWVKFMGRTAPSTLIGFLATLMPQIDVFPDLPNITAPTLVITTEGSAMGGGDETRGWQENIADSELLVLPGNSYHPAARYPRECVRATMDFIQKTKMRAAPARI